MRAIRSSVEDGDTRKMRSSSWASEAAIQASASSGVRSGVIAPDPPAAARSRAKASGPYFSIRFQYVITTAWVPVSRDRLDGGEGVPGADAAGQRLGAGALDGDPVHHRVAVGHADLDQVDTGTPLVAVHAAQGPHGLQRGGHVGVADVQEADQGAATGGPDVGEQPARPARVEARTGGTGRPCS